MTINCVCPTWVCPSTDQTHIYTCFGTDWIIMDRYSLSQWLSMSWLDIMTLLTVDNNKTRQFFHQNSVCLSLSFLVIVSIALLFSLTQFFTVKPFSLCINVLIISFYLSLLPYISQSFSTTLVLSIRACNALECPFVGVSLFQCAKIHTTQIYFWFNTLAEFLVQFWQSRAKERNKSRTNDW